MKTVLSVGMMVCDISLSPVPWNILQIDSASIASPVVSCGGDALNVAVGLAKLGIKVSVSGRVGNDTNGGFIRKTCADYEIDISGLITDQTHKTAVSYVLIDPSGERHFLSNRDIFHELSDKDIPQRAIDQADIVYVGSAMAMQRMNDGGLERLFHRAKAVDKITVMDAAVADAEEPRNWMEALKPAFRYTDVFFPSFEEASAITGKTEITDIVDTFRNSGIKVLGIKLGSKGCCITDFNRVRMIPAVSGIRVVDTCGAGDSFMAGFITAMARGWDLFSSAEFGSCVAALNVQVPGSTGGIPKFDNALAYYHHIFKNKEMRLFK